MILGFYGPSNSGKTTLICALIRELTARDLRVASVKDIHVEGFTIDTEGKDTQLHAAAGSGLVCAYSGRETAFVAKRRLPVETVLDTIESLEAPDVILVEGVRHGDFPKVMVGDTDEAPGTVLRYAGDVDAVLAYIQEGLRGERDRDFPDED